MGILDRIKKAHETKQTLMKALVHGNSGSGKSTLCGTLPRPILYAYTEPQGVVSFQRSCPDGDTIHIKNVEDMRELLRTLREGKRDEDKGTVLGYRSLALDSLTEMQRKIMDQYIDRSDGGEKSGERITISQWGEIIDRTAQLVRSFRDLPMNFLITCLSAEHFVGGEDDSKRVVRPEVAGRSLPNTLAQFFNLVGYAYTRTAQEGVEFRVLLAGNVDFLTKGMPGLAYREVPDVSYWIERSFNRCEPRDPETAMLPWFGESTDAQAANKPASEPEKAPEPETGNDPTEESAEAQASDSAPARGNGAAKSEERKIKPAKVRRLARRQA